MSDIAITAENLSKSYRMYSTPSEKFKEMLHPFGKKYHREFHALRDISFEVKKGESLGIIGLNGSGKSTLLRLICGVLQPTAGAVSVNGRIAALLELGAGFNPEFTGRENLYMNGALMGFSRKEMDNGRFQMIEDFADIGDFIDQPVKVYSSGMFMRLAFATAINVDAEILIIDEILAVGDTNFQLKCFQKVHELKGRGVSLILVAHNEYTIREQTQKCVYLRNGRLGFFGPSEQGISLYIKDNLKEKSNEISSAEAGQAPAVKADYRATLKFFDQCWKETAYIESGATLNLVIECDLKGVEEPILSVNFYGDGGFVYCANSQYENIDLRRLAGQMSKITITIPQLYLPVNSYTCSLTISDVTNANVIEWQDKKYKFCVGRPENTRGSLKLPAHWEAAPIFPKELSAPEIEKAKRHRTRLSVYRVITEEDISDEAYRRSPEFIEKLRAAGMQDTNLDNYWKRVSFIAENCKGEVLEIGSCCGNITRYISQNPRVTHVTAVDVFPDFINQLKAYSFPKVDAICADVREYDFDKGYDCIVMAELIEHLTLDEELALLKKVTQLLNQDAMFIITTPIGFMKDPDHVRGVSRIEFQEHIKTYYGEIVKTGDNEIQQFALVRWCGKRY